MHPDRHAFRDAAADLSFKSVPSVSTMALNMVTDDAAHLDHHFINNSNTVSIRSLQMGGKGITELPIDSSPSVPIDNTFRSTADSHMDVSLAPAGVGSPTTALPFGPVHGGPLGVNLLRFHTDAPLCPSEFRVCCV